MKSKTLILTDRPELPQEKHNYLKAYHWLIENGKLKLPRGQVSNVSFRHDDWCNVYDGHLCNCRPEVIIEGKRYKYPAKVLGDTYAGNHR